MRVLLAVHNVYTDHTSGAAKTYRTLMEWAAAGGHDARVLCTARFDARPPETIEQHLAGLGVKVERGRAPAAYVRHLRSQGRKGVGRPTARFGLAGVAVEMMLSAHNDMRAPDRDEYQQFSAHVDRLIEDFWPDVVVAYGGHPVVHEAMRRARAYGAKTLYGVFNYGYEHPRNFRYADHVQVESTHLAAYYGERAGIRATILPPPIDWSEVVAPPDRRTFLTFVNPSLHKGAGLFARLALMLGTERADIPILVVQSAADATLLNAIPGIDFARFPQIVASPPTRRPADIFELTRVLLVPSVFEEPFGRIAAEATINGIPAIVSDRGGLPETVGDGGVVLPLPDWLEPETTTLPSDAETRPWFDAVCRLWDDAAAYDAASARARAVAERRYAEGPQRRRYLDLLETLASAARGGPAPASATAIRAGSTGRRRRS